MKPLIQVIRSIGNIIKISNNFQKLSVTYLTQNVQSTSTTLVVENTGGLTNTSGLLLVSDVDAENAEIVQYSAVPSSTTMTISALSVAHSRGESINEVSWNKFLIQTSPDQVTWTTLGETPIDPTSTSTSFNDSTGAAGLYYRVAFKNSVSGLISDFSSPIPAIEPNRNSAQAIINSVISDVGVSPNDTIVTQEFLLEALNLARETFDNLAYGYRWDWRQEFSYPIKCLAGTNFVELPDNVDFSETNRSVISVRMNTYNSMRPTPLRYVDKAKFNDLSQLLQGGLTATETLTGATTITLENTGDFNDAGSVFIATSNFSQTTLLIQYTGNNRNTNTLTGVTGVTRDIPVGTQCWSRSISAFIPSVFTIYDNKIWFNYPINDMQQGRNVYIDFYTKLEKITDPYQILQEHYAQVYKPYIKYAIQKRRNESTTLENSDYLEFMQQYNSVMDGIYSGQTTRLITS